MSDEPTSFFEKIGEGIGKGLIRGIISLALAAGVFGGSVIVSNQNAKKTVWTEAGDHLLDAHNEIYGTIDGLNALSNRVVQLEEKLNENKSH